MCERSILGKHLFSLVSNPMENHFKKTDINRSWDLYSYRCHVAKTVNMLFNTLSIFLRQLSKPYTCRHCKYVDRICYRWILKLYNMYFTYMYHTICNEKNPRISYVSSLIPRTVKLT